MTDQHLEEEVRTSMRSWVANIDPLPPQFESIRDRAEHRDRQARRARVVVVAVLVVIAVLGFGGLTRSVGSDDQELRSAAPPAATASVPTSAPALSLAGWNSRLVVDVDDYWEYEFTKDGRRLQVSAYSYGLSERIGEVGQRPPELQEVTVRNGTGYLIAVDSGRYRLDWRENGWTVEADGKPFQSAEEFRTLVEELTFGG